VSIFGIFFRLLLLISTVSLTKTKVKGKDLKTKLVSTLRNAIDEYERIYVLRYENMRAVMFKDIRMDWRESKSVFLINITFSSFVFDIYCLPTEYSSGKIQLRKLH
jgi:hypothetical protein